MLAPLKTSAKVEHSYLTAKYLTKFYLYFCRHGLICATHGNLYALLTSDTGIHCAGFGIFVIMFNII